MYLGTINLFDIVEADVRGQRFYALVTGKAHGELTVSPITRGVSHRHVTARQVVGHYRRSRSRPTARPEVVDAA